MYAVFRAAGRKTAYNPQLLVSLLTRLALQLLGAALGLHLLVVDQVAGCTLDLALQLLAATLDALGGLGGLLACLALCLFGVALGLHLLIADQAPNAVLDMALALLGLAFDSLFVGTHSMAPL